MWDKLLGAIALLMILEGLMPLLNPKGWREIFSQALRLNDGQLRFIGLVSVVLGALLWLLVG